MWSASMALFDEVVDAMEDADEGDVTLLTTALGAGLGAHSGQLGQGHP